MAMKSAGFHLAMKSTWFHEIHQISWNPPDFMAVKSGGFHLAMKSTRFHEIRWPNEPRTNGPIFIPCPLTCKGVEYLFQEAFCSGFVGWGFNTPKGCWTFLRLCRVRNVSEGEEFSSSSVYLPITWWLTKSLGKIELHVCGTVFLTLVHEGEENAQG